MICNACKRYGSDYCISQCSLRTEYQQQIKDNQNDKSDQQYKEPCYI